MRPRAINKIYDFRNTAWAVGRALGMQGLETTANEHHFPTTVPPVTLPPAMVLPAMVLPDSLQSDVQSSFNF